MSGKPFNFEYHSSTNSWSKFPIVGSNSSFKPFGISFSEMQRVKKSLWDSYLVTLSLGRLSSSATCSLFLLVACVCCNKDVVWFVSSLTSVHVEVCSTKMFGVCSSRFRFEVLLFVSSPCLDLLSKKIADWQRLVYSFTCILLELYVYVLFFVVNMCVVYVLSNHCDTSVHFCMINVL